MLRENFVHGKCEILIQMFLAGNLCHWNRSVSNLICFETRRVPFAAEWLFRQCNDWRRILKERGKRGFRPAASLILIFFLTAPLSRAVTEEK